MAERKSTKRIPSEEVQGEGSYVVIRKITYGLAKQLRKESTGEEEDFTTMDKVLVTHVIDWDWVDDEGQPLPLPKDEPEVINRLTDGEIVFLTRAMRGVSEEELKN